MAHLIYLNSYEMNLSDLSHSQICQRVRSVICEAVWEAVWSVWESEVRGRVGGWSASHAQRAMQSDPRLNALLRPRIGLHRPLSVRGRSASHTASHFGLSDRSHDTHTASQIWESDRPLTHTGRCCHPRARLTDFTAKRIASVARVRLDSHGLTDRPHRFESPIGLSRTPAEAMRLAVKSVR